MNNGGGRSLGIVVSTAFFAGSLCFAAVPEPDDPYATNALGVTIGQPISNGFLFVGSRYIDAPYVVEQRGLAIFVNGEFADYAVRPDVAFPTEPPTADPGLPKDLTPTNTIFDALKNPTVAAFGEYLGTTSQKEDYYEKSMEYFRQIPCIAKIVPVPERDSSNLKSFLFYDYAGNSQSVSIPTDHVPYQRPSITYFRQQAQERRAFLEKALTRNEFAFRGGVESYRSFRSSDYWLEVINVLRSDAAVEVKIAQLKRIGFIGPSATVSSIKNSGDRAFLSAFEASSQLEERLNKLKGLPQTRVQPSTNPSAEPPPRPIDSRAARPESEGIPQPARVTNLGGLSQAPVSPPTNRLADVTSVGATGQRGGPGLWWVVGLGAAMGVVGFAVLAWRLGKKQA